MTKRKKWIILIPVIAVTILLTAFLVILILQGPRFKRTPAAPQNIPAGSTVVWRCTKESVHNTGMIGFTQTGGYFYDSIGRCVVEDQYDTVVGNMGKQLYIKNTYEYIPEKHITRVTETDTESERRTMKDYDQNGNLLFEDIQIYSDSYKEYIPYYTAYYEYDPLGEGKLFVCVSWNDGKPEFVHGLFFQDEYTRYSVSFVTPPADLTLPYEGDWRSLLDHYTTDNINTIEEFDTEGRLLRKTNGPAELTDISEVSYEYDSEGRIVAKYEIYDGDRYLREEYTYNPDGSYVDTFYQDRSDKISCIDKYDNQGRLFHSITYPYGGGKPTEERKYQWVDLEDGGYKEIEEIFWKDGTIDHNESEYNKQGQLTRKVTSFHGEPTKDILNVYDDQGRIIKGYDTHFEHEFEYDRYGNLIRESLRSKEHGDSEIRYEYTPFVLTENEIKEANEYHFPGRVQGLTN